MNRHRLYRCRHDRYLAGVAGGVAEYFDVDPSLVRILWVLSIFAGGVGVLLYIAMALVVPIEPEMTPPPGPWQPGSDAWGAQAASGEQTAAGDPSSIPPAGSQMTAPHRHAQGRGARYGASFFGIVLILFGALALADELLPAWADQGRFLWPAFILAVGVLLVVTSIRRRQNDL